MNIEGQIKSMNDWCNGPRTDFGSKETHPLSFTVKVSWYLHRYNF